jgi:hypothetical protein
MKYFICIIVCVTTLFLSTCISRFDIFDVINRTPEGGVVDGPDIGFGKEESPQELSLLDAEATSRFSVRAYFSGDVALKSAQTVGNYTIAGLEIMDVSRDRADFSIVDIGTSEQEDINYTLLVNDVIDVRGNSLNSQNWEIFAGDVPPYIKSVSSFSNKEVVIYFSEAVDSNTINDKKNYAISGLTVTLSSIDILDPRRVSLLTSSQMNGTQYTITIVNVKDLTGNAIISPNSKSFTGNGPVDSIAPKILSASLVDNDTVEARFSEPMDGITSQNIVNYAIEDNTGNPVNLSAAALQPDPSRVWLDIDATFAKNIYTLRVGTAVFDENLNGVKGYPYNIVVFNGAGSTPENFKDGPVIVDPMGEGNNNFSVLTKYKGRVYIGPSNADSTMFRLKPDGSDPEIVDFIFHGSGTDTTTLKPGPDGEEGINYISGGTMNGTEYLFIGPYKTIDFSEIDYIYYTTDNGNTIEFNYLYVSDYLGLYTKSVSSMEIFNDTLYLGCPNRDLVSGRKKPYLIKIQSLGPVSGIDLLGYDMPRLGYYGGNRGWKIGVDIIAEYNNRIYVANGGDATIGADGGIVRSTNSNPGDYGSAPGDWEDITPVRETEWYASTSSRFSVELPKVERLNPADKAFPAMVSFHGRFYIARNTTEGPQLWQYGGSSWRLVADSGFGLTDMNDPDNGALSLLVVNGDSLYVGYDNSVDGIHVWRTNPGITNPVERADFIPVSTDGLGDPSSNQKIYHGLSIADGSTDYLWLLCGKDRGLLKVYRTED